MRLKDTLLGHDVNAICEKNGNTLLHKVAQIGGGIFGPQEFWSDENVLAVTCFLLRKGADKEIKNNYNKLAIDYASNPMKKLLKYGLSAEV
jgi:hypothetical protein